MVVDESHCLQMGVANCSSEEFESPFFHIFTHGIAIVPTHGRDISHTVRRFHTNHNVRLPDLASFYNQI
jgi:hypothetical protein